jgi:hypothetical protein
MSGLFGTLSNTGMEETQDRLGGYQPFASGVYTGKIKLAYAGASAGGARNVTLIVDLNGREYRETIYITNKKGENWFLNKDDKSKKVPLPGFTTIDDICLVATGSPLADQGAEDKMVKVYDNDAKKELPKSVPVLIDLIGKEISLGIIQILENKNEKVGNEYVPTAETRTSNAIDKVFDTESKLTVAEARAGSTTGAFWGAWAERNKDQVRDKRTIKDGVAGAPQAGRPGARAAAGAPVAGAQAGARKSLFGAKPAAA